MSGNNSIPVQIPGLAAASLPLGALDQLIVSQNGIAREVTVQDFTNSIVPSLAGIFLPLAGGTMTGAIVLPGNPMLALQAATKQYVDAAVSGALFLPLAGGIMTGVLATESQILIAGSGGVSGGSRVWSGTSNAQAAITTGASPLTWTGATSVGADNLAPLGLYYNLHTTVDAHLTGGVTGATFLVNADGGKGGVTSTVSYLNVNTTPAGTTNDEFVAGRDWAYGIADSGGSPRHSLIGRTTVASLQAAATNWLNLSGHEVAVEAVSGSSVFDKAGLFIMAYSADAVQGSRTDVGLAIYRQNQSTTTQGWKTGINFGMRGYNPVASNGTFIGFTPNAGGDTTTVDTIVDFNALTTVTSWTWRSPGLWIGPKGDFNKIGNLVQNEFTASNFWIFQLVSGSNGLLFKNNAGTILANMDSTSGISFVGNVQATSYKVGANQVVGARQTGWSAMTGTANIATAYDTSTVTLAQLAARVLSIQAAITTHGLIGP